MCAKLMIFRLLAPLLLLTLGAMAYATTEDLGIAKADRLDYQLRTASATAASTPEAQAVSEPVAARTEPEPASVEGLPIPFVKQPDDLWVRLRAGFKMPETNDPLVRKWENYYASHPQYLQRIFDRSRPYIYHVASELEKRNMPMELALLPMIESAYNPKAVSPAQAAGMWQFIPATGKRFGLERTWWYDGRRDVVAATSAALSYLGELYGMFGDWSLALASYNWGENAVARAVNKKQAVGIEQPGYADIKMPDETRNYVPKLLAVRNIISNPAAFGIALLTLPNKPYFSAISPGKHMDVKIAAELAEIPIEELLRLNPGFVRPVIAHKEDRLLVLPTDKIEVFNKNLASYDKPLLNWQPYVTRPGETYSQLAGRFGLSLAQLKDINDIPAKDARARGQTILVPKSADIVQKEQNTLQALAANRKGELVKKTVPDEKAAAPVTHKVVKGDTLYSVAQKYKITTKDLQKNNKLKGEQLQVGSELKIAKPAGLPKEYIVQKGDTVASLAKKLGMTPASIGKIQPGRRIVIQ